MVAIWVGAKAPTARSRIMIEELDGVLEGNGQLGLPRLETHAANLGSKANV